MLLHIYFYLHRQDADAGGSGKSNNDNLPEKNLLGLNIKTGIFSFDSFLAFSTKYEYFQAMIFVQKIYLTLIRISMYHIVMMFLLHLKVN